MENRGLRCKNNNDHFIPIAISQKAIKSILYVRHIFTNFISFFLDIIRIFFYINVLNRNISVGVIALVTVNYN